MAAKKKKLLCLVGVLLCLCVAIVCGVWYYLSNYDLKIWYGLQDEEAQQEIRTLMEQYLKLSDEYMDYSLQKLGLHQEQIDLMPDLAWAREMDKQFQEKYGSYRTDDYAKEYAELQRQYDDLGKDIDRIGFLMERTMERREHSRDKIEQFGFLGDISRDQIEVILNDK